ncbi:MAG: ATP-binding cassette domain-containing protein [Pseudomonadota bacterium]
MTDRDPDKTVLEARALTRSFHDGSRELKVLRGVDLGVAAGETMAIVGASGSGKTTLLQLLGGLDTPSGGDVRIDGESVFALGAAARGTLRNRALGFVYQFHHLLPEFTARENVAMPLLIRRVPGSEALAAADRLLERVGLSERGEHKPGELSGGERQRAAVARAVITDPVVVLADEPTGNLDAATGRRVLDLMLQLNAEIGTSLVVVTHDLGIAAEMQRQLRLEDGVLSPVGEVQAP